MIKASKLLLVIQPFVSILGQLTSRLEKDISPLPLCLVGIVLSENTILLIPHSQISMQTDQASTPVSLLHVDLEVSYLT